MKKIICNPLLQIVVGFFLFFNGIRQDSGNLIIDYAWIFAGIVGFAILWNGARNLRKAGGGIGL